MHRAKIEHNSQHATKKRLKVNDIRLKTTFYLLYISFNLILLPLQRLKKQYLQIFKILLTWTFLKE